MVWFLDATIQVRNRDRVTTEPENENWRNVLRVLGLPADPVPALGVRAGWPMCSTEPAPDGTFPVVGAGVGGLVEFIGGLLTAILALVMLLRISPLMTGIAIGVIVVVSLLLQKAFTTLRPIFRERGKITAEVTGRLTESLGGVRVIKGYHAEEREEGVFAVGVQRLLDNVMKSLTTISLMSLTATVLMCVVGGTVMWVGARQILATPPTLTLGGFFSFTMYLAFLVAPVFLLAPRMAVARPPHLAALVQLEQPVDGAGLGVLQIF